MADVQRPGHGRRRGVDRVDLLAGLGPVEGVGVVGLPALRPSFPRAPPARACPVRRRRGRWPRRRRTGRGVMGSVAHSAKSYGPAARRREPVPLGRRDRAAVDSRHDVRHPASDRGHVPRPTPRPSGPCWPAGRRPGSSPALDRIEALHRAARRPAARLPGHPPDRHQRQDHHLADDRHPDPGHRAAHRPVHQPARGVDDRADLARRRAADRGAVRRGLQRRRAATPHLVDQRQRAPAVVLRDRGRDGVRRVRRRPGRRRRRRGRHGRLLGRHQRRRRARSR